MKRIALVFALATSLIFGATSFAAVKAGATCTKAGATSTVSGKKYTCIKSGKKLVWDKGVVAKKPAVVIPELPKVDPTPTPSAVPTPTNVLNSNLENSICPKQGNQISDSVGKLECRAVAGNKLAYIRINNDFSALSNPLSPEKLQTCQLSDSRISPVTPPIAFPAKPGFAFRNTGVEKIIVVGIDFPDLPGKGNPTELFASDIAIAGEWIDWYSNQNLKFQFVNYDKWIRAPRESKNYQVTEHGQSLSGLSNEDIKKEFILEIEKFVDISKTSAIWVYYPTEITTIKGKFAERGARVQTKNYGDIFADMYATGSDNYVSKMPNWTYFVHETIHSQGIMGHSPRAPWVMGLMLNDSGPSHALNAWDQITLNWLKENQLYCVTKEELSTVRLKLVPIEREQIGMTTAMIKLSSSKILVVESHRLDKWSYGLGKGFYGVMVYLVDTSFDVSWDGENANGTYLLVEGVNHGNHEPQGTPIPGFENQGSMGLVDGVGVGGDQNRWDLNYIMYLGESITYEGVKISLVSTGDNDTIEVSKVA